MKKNLFVGQLGNRHHSKTVEKSSPVDGRSYRFPG